MVAPKIRDTLPVETALFCHVAADLQRVLSPGQCAQELQRFCRGQFGADFTEKVAHKDPNINVQLFKFLQVLCQY